MREVMVRVLDARRRPRVTVRTKVSPRGPAAIPPSGPAVRRAVDLELLRRRLESRA